MRNNHRWQSELKQNIKTIEGLDKYMDDKVGEIDKIKKVNQEFAFSMTRHYASLIDWDDESDPLKKLVVPDAAEMDPSGNLDVGLEIKNKIQKGCQVKYPSTALLLPFPACFSYCRFCFRKRLFIPDYKGEDLLTDLEKALAFIKKNKEINNVLITGGDPLRMQNDQIENMIVRLFEIPHIKILRFG